MRKYYTNKTYVFYFILMILALGSLLVTNLSYDAEYQLAMAYRFVKGDLMISQMWEPHQTSAFLCAIIMKLYIGVTGSTTGIVLFTHAVGLLIRFGIGIYFYKIIGSEKIPGMLICIFYLLISPKDLLVPEFSNMQIWFSTLMFLFLVHYFQTEKVYLLILSALSFCLGIFSYPSFIIAYFAIIALLIIYSKNKKRDIPLYTLVCLCVAALFIVYLLNQVSWNTIVECLPRALSIEPSHTVSASSKIGAHLLNLVKILGVILLVFTLSLLIHCIYTGIVSVVKHKKFMISLTACIFTSWFIVMSYWLINIIHSKHHGFSSFPFLIIISLGFWKRKLLSDNEKKIYYCGLWASIANFLATLLLSDHALIQAIPYTLIAICVSVLPLYRWFLLNKDNLKFKKAFVCCIHIFLLLIIFRSIYFHVPISGRGQIYSIASDMALIRSGPAIGIITNEEGAAAQRDSMAEWKQYIKPGDTIWILGVPVDTLGYLYEDVNVGAPSVMSTPTYNESLEYYWEVNPDKYPNVIILSSGFGELSWDLSVNVWLMDWIENEYQPDHVIDGNYWRYYFKE